jgi:hydroxymethylbilane synthase
MVIASRRSPLARVQAEYVGACLARLHRGIDIQYLWVQSEGDRIQDIPLADAGGKGLFTRGIEQALLQERADLAVHSMKDLPALNTAGLTIAAAPRRGDVRDCLVARGGAAAVDQLASGSVVGTASPRRKAQLLRLRRDLRVAVIRGNLETRLAKVLGHTPQNGNGQAGPAPSPANPGLDASPYDAAILAVAGLCRGGWQRYAAAPFPVELMLPAACQGALAIQCRSDDHVTLTRCLPLNDPITAACVHAERQVVADLQGDCHSPIAVLAQQMEVDRFRLRARVLSPEGEVCLEEDVVGNGKGLDRLARELVQRLRDRGSDTILHNPTTPTPAPLAAAH